MKELFIAAILLSPAAARAAYSPQMTAVPGSVPTGVNYQGRLEQGGLPVTGTKSMTFRVFSAATGGTPLWTSAAQNVSVSLGLFNVVLPIPVDALIGGASRYLEVEVEGTVLSPREPLNAVPYAMVAKTVEGTIEVSSGGLSLLPAAGGVPALAIASGTSVSVGIATANASALFTVGAASLVVTQDGDLGLGTSQPQGRLSVHDANASVAVGSQGFVELVNEDVTAGNTYGLHFRQLDTLGNMNTVATIDAVGVSHAPGAQSGALSFGTRNAGAYGERLRIDPAGLVGIGPNPSPGSLLHLAAPGNPELRIQSTSGVGRTWALASEDLSQGGFSFIDRTASVRRWALDANGNMAISPTVSGVGPFPSGLSVGANLTVSATIGGAPILHASTTSGNVGLGTAAPVNKLHVEGSNGITVKNGSISALELIPGGSLNVLKWYGSNALVIGNDPAIANAGNGASGNPLVTITPSGNVGIGTTTAAGRLDVVGSDMYFGGVAGGGQGVLRMVPFNDAGEQNFWFELYNEARGGTGNKFMFAGLSGTNPTMAVDVTNMRVGINTGIATPADRLTVVAGNVGVDRSSVFGHKAGSYSFMREAQNAIGSASTVANVLSYNAVFDTGPDNRWEGINGGRASAIVVGEGARPISLHVSNALAAGGDPITWTEALTVDSAGNVGVGATAPAAKLQVAGGDAYTSTAGSGLIVKSPDGLTCRRIGIDNTGALALTVIACP